MPWTVADGSCPPGGFLPGGHNVRFSEPDAGNAHGSVVFRRPYIFKAVASVLVDIERSALAAAAEGTDIEAGIADPVRKLLEQVSVHVKGLVYFCAFCRFSP